MSAQIKSSTWWLSRGALDIAVANAVAANGPANALAVRTAKRIAVQARRNVLAGERMSRSKKYATRKGKGTRKPGGNTGKLPAASSYRQQVAKEIYYKDLQVKRRKSVAPGSDIPVALVVADHWASQAFELGDGPDLPVSRFMGAAARSATGGAVTMRGGT